MTSSGKVHPRAVRNVVMAREVVSKWVDDRATPEYRFYVMASPSYFTKYLRSFREGRVKLSGVKSFSDFGVKEASDGFYVWSSDFDRMKELERYFSRVGIETTWIW